MFRTALLAALLTTGIAGYAAAAEQPITVLGTGENFAVDYSNDGGNILGGGNVSVTNRGESAIYHHAANSPTQHGWTPHVVNQGESVRITYTPAPDANPQPAG